MTYIQGPIPPSGPEAVTNRYIRPEPPQAPDRGSPQDKVQISELARLKAKLATVPELREDLVNRVKAEIEAGTYDTIDKVQIAAEKLLAELREDGIL